MKKMLYAWMALHLSYIAVVNLLASYDLWRDTQPATLPVVPLPQLFQMLPARYYGRLTGAEHGYGFFGLNVRSNGALTGDCGGQKLEPTGRSFETALRLITLANTLTDGWLQPSSAPESRSQQPNAYQALVLRNIALTLHQQAQCPDTTLTLRYELLVFPSLAQVRQGQALRYSVRPLLNSLYSFRAHAR